MSKKKEPESSHKPRSVTPIKLIMNCSAKKMINGKIMEMGEESNEIPFMPLYKNPFSNHAENEQNLKLRETKKSIITREFLSPSKSTSNANKLQSLDPE